MTEPSRASGLLLLAAAALALVRSRPPSARGTDTPQGEFSAARALEAFRRVVGDEAPRPVGSETHARVREGLVNELASLGLEPSVLEGAAATTTSIALARNVIARIPGRESGKSVLLCAHYDSVASGPGAGDDGSGVAMLLEVARALRTSEPLRRPIDLLFTDAEECGLVGAKAYARQTLAQEVEVVVNADARGTSGPAFLFETGPGNADLVRLYARSVDRPCATSAAYEVYKRMPNDTDFTVFKGLGIPGLNFAFIEGLRRYHTPRDDLAHLSPASVQHEGDQVLAMARALAEQDYDAKADGDLVYADVLGLFLLRWPEAWSLPASIAILLALLLLAARDVRADSASAGAIGRGIVLALATTTAAAAAAPLIVRGIEFLRGHPEPWAAHPLPFEIAIVAGGILAAGLVGRITWFTRADGGARWIALAAAGVASSALVPGASYLFLVPCACAVLVRLPRAARRSALAATLPALALFVLWIPLSLGLVQAVDLAIPIALGAPAGVLIAAAASTTRRPGLRAPAAITVVAIVAALAVPAYTADAPAWTNLVHVEEAEKPGARLVAVTYGSPLSAALRKEAEFSAAPEPVLPAAPWLPSGYAAETERSGAAAPLLDVLSTREDPEGRVIEIRITSPRRSTLFVVGLRGLTGARDGGVLSATLGDRKVRDWTWSASRGSAEGLFDSRRVFFGVPPEGIRLVVRAPLGRPAEILVLDTAFGLPPGDARFAAARPETHVPRSLGDQWVVARTFDL